jgi:hypothetical protein
MTCPQCETHRVEPTERWTIAGRKMTVPLVRMWACLNRECQHEWPREFTDLSVAPTSSPQEVAYDSHQL